MATGHERYPHAGDVVHLFIERKDYTGPFMPGFQRMEIIYNPTETGLLYVDHCVGNVGWNQMNLGLNFTKKSWGSGISLLDDKDISTEYSALMSKVMSNGNGICQIPHQ